MYKAVFDGNIKANAFTSTSGSTFTDIVVPENAENFKVISILFVCFAQC